MLPNPGGAIIRADHGARSLDETQGPDQGIQRHVDQPRRRALMLQRGEELETVEPAVGTSAIEAETSSLAKQLRLGGT